MLFRIQIILMLLSFVGCQSRDVVYLTSKDKSSTITILIKGNMRYIINGKKAKVPKVNFVKLNIENINPLGDALQVCWDEDGYFWKLINNNAVILENRLETGKFFFDTELPKDQRGIPTQKDYVKNNCIVYDFHRKELLFDAGGNSGAE